jgi:hypothetical protein
MIGLLTLAAIAVAQQTVDWRVIHHHFLSGYALSFLAFAMLFLSWRRSLPALPIGLMSTWLKLHVGTGVLLMPVFWLHIGQVWPNGVFEQILAGLFYGTLISGIAGRLLQKILPSKLTNSGGEVTRERIPREIIGVRIEIERLLVDCAEQTGKRSLALAYEQTLAWYFRKPRFLLAHIIGATAGRHWFDHHAKRLALSLDPTERGYLDQIRELAKQKHSLDHHYAVQSLLLRWLFVHVPAAIAFYVFAIWHIALVHVYAQ